MEQLPELFSSRRPRQEKAREELEAELYQQIGQLKMELEWLNKRAEVEKAMATMSVIRQCGLLELSLLMGME
jgi:putative transposase